MTRARGGRARRGQPADHERPATVGLDDLNLDAVGGADRVGGAARQVFSLDPQNNRAVILV
jgi:hypothetical protein